MDVPQGFRMRLMTRARVSTSLVCPITRASKGCSESFLSEVMLLLFIGISELSEDLERRLFMFGNGVQSYDRHDVRPGCLWGDPLGWGRGVVGRRSTTTPLFVRL
jgi:hypothetical protein